MSRRISRPPIASRVVVPVEQACNGTPAGCGAHDLYTPAIERDWVGTTVYEDRDLANTVVDCLACHQSRGPGTPKILRMQQRKTPWTHFFRRDREGGAQLLDDYFSAHHTSEAYAGIPGVEIEHSDPGQLEGLVENEGFRAQPNEFMSDLIEPPMLVFRDPKRVEAWQRIYRRALSGDAIPVPYPAPRASDPFRLDRAGRVYRRVMREELAPSELPDLGGLIADEARPLVGLRPAPDATGREVLVQMCQRCHHQHLDQTLSRARFDMSRFEEMPKSERDEAIRRLRLPPTDPKAMPPRRFGELGAVERARAIEALR